MKNRVWHWVIFYRTKKVSSESDHKWLRYLFPFTKNFKIRYHLHGFPIFLEPLGAFWILICAHMTKIMYQRVDGSLCINASWYPGSSDPQIRGFRLSSVCMNRLKKFFFVRKIIVEAPQYVKVHTQ